MVKKITIAEDGSFIRQESVFRNWVSACGEKEEVGSNRYIAEAGRYHLYVALNCPWAQRTLILRKLKGLENVISHTVVNPQRTDKGWTFSGFKGSGEEPNLKAKYVSDLYFASDEKYAGRYTVLILWDKKHKVIVNNESADIIRIFNSSFNEFTDVSYDYYPFEYREEIDGINDFIYRYLNNGVYRAGFAKSQVAYEKAVADVFFALDQIEVRLESREYLLDVITEADWRLFPTLIRFDAVYYTLFKCNLRRVADYPRIFKYLKKLLSVPGISETVNFEHIKAGYWRKSERNPSGIIPVGPDVDQLFGDLL